MVNSILFLMFVIYISSLLIGFKIKKRKKDHLNKRYFKYKKTLYVFIFFIFAYSSFFIYLGQLFHPLLGITFVLNILFIFYFTTFVTQKTRCWKQHRMIIYNFLLLPVIYFCSIVLETTFINYIVFIIAIYNILEFQFAKFSFRGKLLWD